MFSPLCTSCNAQSGDAVVCYLQSSIFSRRLLKQIQEQLARVRRPPEIPTFQEEGERQIKRFGYRGRRCKGNRHPNAYRGRWSHGDHGPNANRSSLRGGGFVVTTGGCCRRWPRSGDDAKWGFREAGVFRGLSRCRCWCCHCWCCRDRYF